MEEIEGDFEHALENLIGSLREAKDERVSPWLLLTEWDAKRGNDWYTNTKKWDQSKAEKVEYHVVYRTSDTTASITITLDKKVRTHEDVLGMRKYIENQKGEQVVITNWIELEG